MARPSELKTAALWSILLLGMTGPSPVGAQSSAAAAATDAQKQMVARLSGWSDSEGQTVPFSRSTPEERSTAVAGQVAAMDTRALNFIFVFFDQEEDDEVGSRAFARFLEQHELDVHSVHIADLAGWDEGGTGLVQIQSATPELDRLYHEAASELGIPIEVVGGASSDNKSFLVAAIPTVGVFQPEIHPQLHRPTDTYEIVDFNYLGIMTRLVGDAMRALAVTNAR